MFVEVVTVFNGIIYRFRNGYHDIPIDIIIEAEFLLGVVNKALYYPDVLS